MSFKLKIYTITLAFASSITLYGQVNVVLVEPSVQKYIGDVSELDRSKYLTSMHLAIRHYWNHSTKNIM